MLSGDGGLGKSLLMQQLQTAAAIGRPWLGLQTRPCKSLAIYCEDDDDELKRRQAAINRHYDCRPSDLEHVMWESRAGRESVLMAFGRWGDDGHLAPLFEQVRLKAKDHGAEIVILDTLADVFSGNEVDRNQPRTFIRMMRRLAIELQGCVILTQHPSMAGLATGTGSSGSTGWNNSVRSRLYLTTPKPKKGESEPDPNQRLLKTMKNNQGPYGGKLALKWDRGVFVPVEGPAPRDYSEPQLDDDWPSGP